MAERDEWRTPFYDQEGRRRVSFGPGPTGRYGSFEGGEYRRESTKSLIQQFLAEAQNLARAEIQLAKAELREDMKDAGRGAGMLGVGGALLYAGVLCLLGFVVALLSLAMKVWVAALIVGLLAVGIGAMMAMDGRSKLKQARPEDFPRSLKENREWASTTMRDVRSNRRVHA